MEELDVFKTENLALKRENARLHKVITYMTEVLVNSYHARASSEIDNFTHDYKEENHE
ncbi:hypothetical protein [Streptococcus thoraltensis]|uniref:hypothetical protein n=1 Tax=Streptococcus thoraltensis TaxID=55085 RepID=UPI001F55D829|nr:hypothetical protein [Streptococcus thoraltensis]